MWEVNKSGRGQVIDLAQYEAVAQTQGNCLPLYTGEGVAYGHTGNKAPGFQPYDTFQCLDGWVFIGCLGPVMFARVAGVLGLDPAVYSYEACSKDAAAVNSDKGREVDQRLREFCAAPHGPRRRDDPQQGADRLLAVFGVADQYHDDHYRARDMTVPVVDHQSGVPVHVYGVVPKMSLTPGRIWRGAASIGEDTTDILSTDARPVGTADRRPLRRPASCTAPSPTPQHRWNPRTPEPVTSCGVRPVERGCRHSVPRSKRPVLPTRGGGAPAPGSSVPSRRGRQQRCR